MVTPSEHRRAAQTAGSDARRWPRRTAPRVSARHAAHHTRRQPIGRRGRKTAAGANHPRPAGRPAAAAMVTLPSTTVKRCETRACSRSRRKTARTPNGQREALSTPPDGPPSTTHLASLYRLRVRRRHARPDSRSRADRSRTASDHVELKRKLSDVTTLRSSGAAAPDPPADGREAGPLDRLRTPPGLSRPRVGERDLRTCYGVAFSSSSVWLRRARGSVTE